MLRALLTTFLTVVSLQVHAQGATSPEGLIDAYASALKARDLQAFVNLFALPREQDRVVVEGQFRRQSAMRIESAKIVPFAVYEQRYRKAMARLGKSTATPPEVWAEISFASVAASNGGVEQESSILAVVRRDGRYFISW